MKSLSCWLPCLLLAMSLYGFKALRFPIHWWAENLNVASKGSGKPATAFPGG